MNVSAAQSSLEKFLEVKRAAEQRMRQTEKVPSANKPQESFLEIIKGARKKDDNTVKAVLDRPMPPVRKSSATATASVKAAQTADGLLSVYGMNSFLSKNLSETPAREALQKTHHLGKLFDAVA